MTSLYDPGDYCQRVSLYASGRILSKTFTREDALIVSKMIKECRLENLFGHRKSIEYTWSKDIHNGKKSLRYYAWSIINKIHPRELYCGLNTDQYRALAIYLYLTRNLPRSRKIAKNILIGYILRGTVSPSLTESIILKPYSIVLLFKMFRCLFPVFALLRSLYGLSVKSEMLKTNQEGTTNKVSMLPTMLLLGFELPTDNYIKETYSIFFDKGEDRILIRNSITDGVIYAKTNHEVY